jgi:2-polyprenyl-6-methoxyphenol hydroxylase-like FAD-dependent oxidoreductase
LLARRGHRVTLLEKARHPRFHIGESLLPANLPLFEKLGVADAVKAIGMEKWGAEFVSPWHDHQQSFEFADAMDKCMPMAYQVRRSQFDEILIRNAGDKNARVVEGCEVKAVDFLPGHAGALVHARHEDGSTEAVHARFVVDASGRDTFLGNRLKAKQRNRNHASAAIYAHFSEVERRPGKAAGNITVYWFDHGWMWLIPLADGMTSVGAVTRPDYLKTRKQKSLEQFLRETIALCAPLNERLQHARLVSAVEATGNYSYACDHSHGSNYLLLGDAYAFIDPMFSSGVLLAMQSAFVGADTIDTCLRHPQRATAALAHFEQTARIGPRVFSWFIYRMNAPTFRDMFMNPSNIFRVKEALLSVLAGDLYRNTPIRGPLLIFKGIYYAKSLSSPRRAWKSWRMRKANVKRAAVPGAPD